jgi:hypothetical protein
MPPTGAVAVVVAFAALRRPREGRAEVRRVFRISSRDWLSLSDIFDDDLMVLGDGVVEKLRFSMEANRCYESGSERVWQK